LIPTDAATSTTPYDLNTNTWFMRQETQGPMDYGYWLIIFGEPVSVVFTANGYWLPIGKS
jgi:hypothetical protein